MSVVNTASKMLTGTQPKVLHTAAGLAVLTSISLTTALALNDVFNLMVIAADASDPDGLGPTITGVTLDCDQLDSNATPTITLDVGDIGPGGSGGSQTRFFSGSTVAQAGGCVYPSIAGIVGFQPFSGSFASYTTVSGLTDTISAKVHVGAATAKAGTLRLLVEYGYDA